MGGQVMTLYGGPGIIDTLTSRGVTNLYDRPQLREHGYVAVSSAQVPHHATALTGSNDRRRFKLQ